MQSTPTIPEEAALSPRLTGSPRASGARNRCRQQASHLGPTLQASCSTPTLSCSSSCRGNYQEAYRSFSPEEEWKLQMKGERERKLAAAKELRLQQQEERKQEEERTRLAREAVENEKREAQRRLAEESRLKRTMDIEDKREQEALRAQHLAQERARQYEAERKPWSVRRLSPSSRRTLGLESRKEDWWQEQKNNLATGEKELRIAEAKLQEENARRERLQREDQVRLSYYAQKKALETNRERKRQKELIKRDRQKEELEARRDRHLKQRDNRLQEARARELLEFQQQQRELYLRQQAEQQQEIEALKAKGAKELAIREAKDARQLQRDMARISELKVRTRQEKREIILQETKEQQLKNERLRRALDIDLRRERAEDARREREEQRRQEEELHSQLIFPDPPRLKLPSPGPITAHLDAILSARTMTSSRSEGYLATCFSAR